MNTDKNGVLSAVFDLPNARLSTTTVAGSAHQDTAGYDQNYVWSAVYDPATKTLRVIEV